VAALAIPQSMAYAVVAGVPPEMGLLAAALPAVVAALLGSSRFLVSGPTNPTALLIGVSIVGPAVAAGGRVPVETVVATGLLVGLLLVGFGLLGFGRASRFLSDSVLCGFAVGVGLLIALRQVPELAGVESVARAQGPFAPTVWRFLLDAVQSLGRADPRALGLGIGVPVAILALRGLDPRIPGALIALAIAGAVAAGMGWTAGPDALRTLAPLALGWPSLSPPADLGPAVIGPPALAIALLVTVQSMAAARALMPPDGEQLDPDRELVSQGAGNLTAALVGAIPTSGSLTRSSLLRAAGGRSRLAALVSGAVILLLLPFLSPVLTHLPLAALAGLVVYSGLELVDLPAIRRASVTRGDALILIVTLLATIWIDLVQAISAGVVLSLVLLVRRSGRLQMVEVVQVTRDRLREIPIDESTGKSRAVVLHLEGDLNFAVAPQLSEQLHRIAARGPEVLVLRLKRARHLDATVLEVLRRAFGELHERGASMLLCGLTDEQAELLAKTELGRRLGSEGLIRAGPRLFEGMQLALATARTRLGSRPDEDLFRTEGPTGLSYEI
jgi:SulP family sulfate permease